MLGSVTFFCSMDFQVSGKIIDYFYISAFTAGRGLVAAASGVGIAALCFYGLGLSNEVGTLERSA